MSKNYAIIIQFVAPLTTFCWTGAQRSDVYKRDVFVTSWRFHNRAWQPQRHDRLRETSGTLWIHRGALTNQRCSLATGCGIITRSTTRFRDISSAILNDVIWLKRGSKSPIERYIYLCNDKRVCWWRWAVNHYVICSYSDDKIQSPHMYSTFPYHRTPFFPGLVDAMRCLALSFVVLLCHVWLKINHMLMADSNTNRNCIMSFGNIMYVQGVKWIFIFIEISYVENYPKPRQNKTRQC